MKKLSILLAIIILLAAPAAALAEGESAVLSIDNANIYAGMDKAYNAGYTPAVSGGTATIILPLVANAGAIQGEQITVTPSLGEPAASPFVFKNYQKTVSLGPNAVNGGAGTVPSYLVRFDLELAKSRINGVYPVGIDVQAKNTAGEPIQQTFTAYVTITDGKDPTAPESTPRPQSQPKIIVSGYSVNPSPVNAGESFTATVTLKNTNEKKAVQNMTVTVSCDCPNFSLQNDSSTIFAGKLAKGATTDIELKYTTDMETPAQRYNITLAIEYENSDASSLSSSGVIQVQVAQPLKVQLEPPVIPQAVNAGDTMPLKFQVMNMGRGMVYNVRCELAAPGLIPSETAFIGNMEPGTAKEGEMDVFVGMKNMTEGYEGEDKYGPTAGKITLKYEDGNGKEYTADTDIFTSINPPVISPVLATEEEPDKASQWWISLVIGGAVIAVLVVVLVARRKKGKRHEDI